MAQDDEEGFPEALIVGHSAALKNAVPEMIQFSLQDCVLNVHGALITVQVNFLLVTQTLTLTPQPCLSATQIPASTHCSLHPASPSFPPIREDGAMSPSTVEPIPFAQSV